jgi:signal transduction histidine kinase
MFPKIHSAVKLPFHTIEDLRLRIGWYINLRWIAIFGLLSSIAIGEGIFKFPIAYNELIVTTIILSVLNLVYFFLWRFLPFTVEYKELGFAEMQIFNDFVLISFIIHYSGGVANPFYFLYMVQVILSGILFPGAILPYVNAALAAVILLIWSLFEYFNLVDIYPLSGKPVTFEIMIISIAAFIIINFSSIYIINNFMIRYRQLKNIIDEKNLELQNAIDDRNKAFRFSAHEIKAPITAIKSTLEVVKDLYKGDIKPEVFDLIIRAERRSDQVLRMVKEMIAITQYNLSTEKPALEKVDFGELLSQIVKQQQSYALAKGIKLFVILPKTEIEVEVDKAGIEKVIDNLLSNALRYTPDGGIVKIKFLRKKMSFGFSITDTGIGIADKDLDLIFEEFYRTKEAKQMEQIGTGLGLNLVREIVRKNGGTITVESEPGKGSTFTVELPAKYEGDESEEERREYKNIYTHYLFE